MEEQAIIQFFKKDKFAEFCGIELIEASIGSAKTKMAILPQHLNGLGIVHGGAIFTLADFTFAAASNSHGTVAVAINASVSYMKATSKGTLYAEAKEISVNPKIGSYTIRVTDDSGELIAIFQGMVYRKKDVLGLSS